jgi:phosphoribosyl 1,2-cyclic phosphodiesterase
MDFIKFLGTAGARFAVIRQIRKSGGIWVSLDDTNILIDPGPGSLTRCLNSRPVLHPTSLDGIFLSHRHIDHSNDVNIMIEAMTDGGRKRHGIVFAPSDALDIDPVILHHFRSHVEYINVLKEGKEYELKSIRLSTPIRHLHSVETYGVNIIGKNHRISYVSDTKYFEDLSKHYKEEVLILNVVLKNSKDYINHLSIEDIESIIHDCHPKLCILTHFGMTMIKSKPWEIASEISEKIGVHTIAASDGMTIELETIKE